MSKNTDLTRNYFLELLMKEIHKTTHLRQKDLHYLEKGITKKKDISCL
jgi:hypothetical protein